MKEIDNLFWKLGIAGYFVGCYQLKTAVKLVWSGECDMKSATKNLYPMVADLLGTNAHNIERNIRTIIEVFWERGNRDYLNEILQRNIVDKPTAKEFIDMLVGYLQHCEQHR